MNLALLLLGPGDLRRSRGYLLCLGTLLLCVGLFIVIDASDTVTLISLEAFGWVMVVAGLAKLAFSILAGSGGMPTIYVVQGVVYIVLGMAIAEYSGESRQALPWIFGLAMLVNGLYQAGSALVIRYPKWGWFLASGAAHLIFGGLLFLNWRQAYTWVAPLVLGAGLALLGATTLRIALRLSRYMHTGGTWGPLDAVRYYLDFHVPQRFKERYLAREIESAPTSGQPHGDLLVHVWTPSTIARTRENANPVSRYVAARTEDGKFVVGHSALEMNPDVYISHCDGDPNAFDNSNEVLNTLRSRDVPGEFLPSFEEELKTYVPPSATLRYRNFNPETLRTLWRLYRQDATYNFTNRNCSVAVALALEAAVMGSRGGGQRVRTLFSLLLDRDLWVAHLVRWKAREMVWTPGMMLEYAVALQQIVEHD